MTTPDPKKFYNETMPKKIGVDYEYTRWFKNEIQEAGYTLTRAAITEHVLSDETHIPLRILELGPGAGTWTKLLVATYPEAYIDLVDISKEMLARARGALKKNEHIRYIESDILDFTPEGEYDLFFSSRVLEYIPDKMHFAKKIYSTLSSGGHGFLITKMPHYVREKMLGKEASQFHSGQIAPGTLRAILHDVGFMDIDCYPVTVSIPLLHSARLNLILGRLLGRLPLGLFGRFFAESYCVLFRKP